MIPPVKDLLKLSIVRFNLRGSAIAALVLVAGLCFAVMQFTAPPVLLGKLTDALPGIVGTGPATQLHDEFVRARPGTDDYGTYAVTVSEVLGREALRMPQEERDTFFSRNSTALMPVVQWVLLYGALWILVEGLAKLFGLVIAARPAGAPGTFIAFLQWLPKLIGLWFVLLICCGTWITVLAITAAAFFAPFLLPVTVPFALLVPLLIFPRFFAAPVILITEKTRILDAVRLSYKRTKGRYGRVLSAVISAQAVVFLAEQGANILVSTVIGIASTRSPYAPLIALVLPFIHVIGIAYRNMFTVELSDALKS